MLFGGFNMCNKISSLVPCAFNNIALFKITVAGNPWACAREVWRAWEYGKTTKASDNVKHVRSQENYTHKFQLTEIVFQTNLMNWSKDLK